MGKEQRKQRTGMLISFVTMDIIVCLHWTANDIYSSTMNPRVEWNCLEKSSQYVHEHLLNEITN